MSFLRYKSTYNIKIETSGRKSASIEGSAFIKIFGDSGETPVITLSPPQASFSKGSLTMFSVEMLTNLGSIHEINLGHSSSKKWLVQNIEIQNTDTREKWSFPCCQWIDGADDKIPKKKLYPVQESKEPLKKERILSLICGGSNRTHVDKAAKGLQGEDSFFFIDRTCVSPFAPYNAIGVADGVADWRYKKNIDAGEYARQLMDQCEETIYARDMVTPYSVISEAKSSMDRLDTPGSCTAVICVLNRRSYELQSYVLGDSKLLVIRDGTILYASPSQQKRFILSSIGGESVTEGAQYNIKLKSGDMILVGSDGLFDNIYEETLCNHIWRLRAANPTDLAAFLTKMAADISVSETDETPWSREASDQLDMVYKGGKKDDITAVIGKVVSEKREILPNSG
ncbi:hypothetical protein WA158_004633 [Blastocystis sp. Blastoise]